MKISRPALLLDKQKCLRNIERMADKAKRNNLIFRPHFKTHQSRQIGDWFRQFGVNNITVSSVRMAQYFAAAGWRNITVAFPFNRLEIDDVNELAAKIDLNILLIHPESADFLAKNLKHKAGVFIKIDCGYHRCGILSENPEEIDLVVNAVSRVEKLVFKGFLTHSGHTYLAPTFKQIHAIHEVTKYKMNLLKERYQAQYPDLIISVGDTPSSSLEENFAGIDEIRPGNFVFYDVMQQQLGICEAEQIAVTVACPVVSKNKQRNELTIYGGAVHLSKEHLTGRDGIPKYGLVVKLTKSGWSSYLNGVYVSSLSQEHGTVKVPFGNFDQFRVGDVLGILPVHSCLTANLMREYLTLDGDRLEHL